ncbi:MAG TPA: 50S ribosomal protein L21 [Allosphingosinicella sp.]|nr:50S ribosomal protein L21 [Allosphingosinicella sp.]
MFAIVRTGGKQYRVAAGDKIVIEKIAGEAGDTISLDDVLLAGEGGDLKSTDGLVVAAEIIAQAKADKVTVFKKKRRHNYRRKRGHRQQLTILRILSIGGKKAETKKAAPASTEKAPAAEKPAKAAAKPVPSKAEGPKPEAPAKGGAEAAPEATAEAPKKAAATRKAPDAKADAPKKSTKKPAAGKAE